MNSIAFLLLANSSSEFDGSQEMELTIGSLSIIIGSSGSSRLSDLMKPDPLANKPETEEERACQTHSNTEDLAVGSNDISKVHQLCVIITEGEEENSSEGSKKVDRQVDKVKEHNKKEKKKVHVSAGEWRMIKSAINYDTELPEGSRREVLMGYQYALYQHRKKLREESDTSQTYL
jgi:hypothetical protein